MPSPVLIGTPAPSKKTSFGTGPFAVTLRNAGDPVIAAGEALVVAVNYSVGAERNYPTPSGWVLLDRAIGNSSSFETYLYARAAAGDDTLLLDNTAGGSVGVALAYRFGTWSGSVSDIVGDIVNRFSTIGDPPPLSFPWGSADSLTLAGIAIGDAITIGTYPTGYAIGQAQVVEGGVTNRLAMAARQLTASSEDPSSFGPGLSDGFSQTFTIAIRGTAGGTSGTANGVTLTAAASLTSGAASGAAGTLNLQAVGMEFGRRTGLAISSFALEASVNYRYTVHADALVLGAPIFTSGVVATDSGGKLPNASNAAFIAGQTVWVCAVRQADGQRAIFPMVVA